MARRSRPKSRTSCKVAGKDVEAHIGTRHRARHPLASEHTVKQMQPHESRRYHLQFLGGIEPDKLSLSTTGLQRESQHPGSRIKPPASGELNSFKRGQQDIACVSTDRPWKPNKHSLSAPPPSTSPRKRENTTYRVPANHSNLSVFSLFNISSMILPEKSRRRASVAHQCNVSRPADLVHLLCTPEAPLRGADNAEAMYRRPANWLKSSKKAAGRQLKSSAHAAPTSNVPWLSPNNFQHRGPCIVEAPRSGADVVDTTYRRPASGVKSFGKGRRQACCVFNCNQPLRAPRTSTPSTRSCFKLTAALPLIPFMILPNNLFPLAPHSIFNIQRSTGSKFEISPSREPGLRVQHRSRLAASLSPLRRLGAHQICFGSPLYVAAPDSLAAANQPSNSPQSGLRLSTGHCGFKYSLAIPCVPGCNSSISSDANTTSNFFFRVPQQEVHGPPPFKISLDVRVQPRARPSRACSIQQSSFIFCSLALFFSPNSTSS
ncbi:hypothetical protein DFH06DRAFT_1378747 [Mycena polygramma]|nr:hypothetical protein DFH06DRAFT_1378747 [Mycena polygramma]